MSEELKVILFLIGLIGGIALTICIICWVAQIYNNRRTINAVLHHLGFTIPYDESMKVLTKKLKEEEG